ncbi:hypothetical protein [Arthrobacter sp. RCC_34]|uniref:hypothetical protein n=1 Tax=Arthrobacter sp. RCC_34 TaxID=3239230 RepID=UPI003525B86B
MTGTTLAGITFPADAKAAALTKVSREAMANPTTYSIQFSSARWATGAPKVFVVDSADAISSAVATPAAASQNVPLLLVDTSAPQPVLDEIRRLGAQEAIMVGPSFSPKSIVRQQINSVTATQQWITGAGPLEIDVPLSTSFSAPVDELYITDGGQTADLVTAASASAYQKSPLLTIGATLDSFEESALARLKPKRIVFVGNAPAVSAALSKVEALGYPTISVEGTGPVERNQNVVDILRGKNIDTRKFRISVPQAATAAIPAIYEGAVSGTIIRFASSGSALSGPIGVEASSWGSEGKDGRVIATSSAIGDSFMSQLESALTKARPSKPGFQVLGSSTGADGVRSVEMSPYVGASLYRIFDLSGAKVGESTTPSFKLPATETTFSAKAYGSTGTLLATRDLRIVIEDQDQAKPTIAAVISSDAQISVVNWKKQVTDTRPRTIVRSEVVRTPEGTLTFQGATRIGMTCNSEYVDNSRPAGKEVIYEVLQDGTESTNICATANPDRGNRETEIKLTSARVPASATQLSLTKPFAASLGQASPESNSPTPTIAEQALIDSRQQSSAGAGATPMARNVAAASPLPWTFRYQTFIRDRYIRPADWDTQVFDGNDRMFGAWREPYKTRADVTYYFDQNWRIVNRTYNKSVGVTKEYHCSQGSFNDCRFVKQAQASADGIRMREYNLWGAQITNIDHDVALPIKPHGFGWGLIEAPGISYAANYRYGVGGFHLSGWHDGAPDHEIWGGYVPGEYIPFMLDARNCDFGRGLAGFCNVRFDIKV